ncbi:11208_t:CDS:2, partial [Cetraspora pellucida]
ENSLVEMVDPSVVEHEMQFLSIVGCEQNLVEMVDPPVVGQTFCSWEELDRFISLYAKSQNI